MTAGASSLRHDRTEQNFGFRRDAFKLAGGMQEQTTEVWHLGFALGYERSWLDVGKLSSTDGDHVQASVTVKGRFGATALAASLSGGLGWLDSKRSVALPTPGVTAKSSQRLGFVSPDLRLSHDFEQRSWYLRPLVDAAVTHVHLHDFSESGAGGANLDVRSQSETYVTFSPAVEIDGEWAGTRDVLLRPYFRAGLIHLASGSTPSVSASFQGAPTGTAPFTVIGRNDRNPGELSLGVDVLNPDGMSLRIGYAGQFSSRTHSHAGTLKLSVPF